MLLRSPLHLAASTFALRASADKLRLASSLARAGQSHMTRMAMRFMGRPCDAQNPPPPCGEVGEHLGRQRKGEPGGGRVRDPAKTQSGGALMHFAPHPAFFARTRSEGRPPHKGEVRFGACTSFISYAIALPASGGGKWTRALRFPPPFTGEVPSTSSRARRMGEAIVKALPIALAAIVVVAAPAAADSGVFQDQNIS